MPVKCRKKVKVKKTRSNASRKKSVKFPSVKVVSLHLAKCTRDSLSCLLSIIRKAEKNSVTETEIKEKNDSTTIPGSNEIKLTSSFITIQASETVDSITKKEELKKLKTKRQKKYMTLGRIFLSDFKFFAELGDRNANSNRMSYPKTLWWLRKAEILEHRRVTIRDVEVHFINALKRGYQLRILEFIRFLKSLCEDRGLKMSTVLKKLLSCRENRPITRKSTVSSKKKSRKRKQKRSTQVTSNSSMRKENIVKQFSRFSMVENKFFQETTFEPLESQDKGQSFKEHASIRNDGYMNETPIKSINLGNNIPFDTENYPLQQKQSLTRIKTNPCESERMWDDIKLLRTKLSKENYQDYFNAELLKITEIEKPILSDTKSLLISSNFYRNKSQRRNVHNIKVIGRELAFFKDREEDNYEFTDPEPFAKTLGPTEVVNEGYHPKGCLLANKITEKLPFHNDTTIKLNKAADNQLQENSKEKLVISTEDTSAIIYVQYLNQETKIKNIHCNNQTNVTETASKCKSSTLKAFQMGLQRELEIAPSASQSKSMNTFSGQKTKSPSVQIKYNIQESGSRIIDKSISQNCRKKLILSSDTDKIDQKNLRNESPNKMDKNVLLNCRKKPDCTEKLRDNANETIIQTSMKTRKGIISPRDKSRNTTQFEKSSYKSKTFKTLDRKIKELRKEDNLQEKETQISDIRGTSDNLVSNCDRSRKEKMRTFSNLPVVQVKQGLLKLRKSKISRKMLNLVNLESKNIKTNRKSKSTIYKKHTKYCSTNILKSSAGTTEETSKHKHVLDNDEEDDTSNADLKTQKPLSNSRIFDMNDKMSKMHIIKPNANHNTSKKEKTHLVTERKRTKSVDTRINKENIDKTKEPTETQCSLNDEVNKKGKKIHESNFNSKNSKRNDKISEANISKAKSANFKAITKKGEIQPNACIKSKLTSNKCNAKKHILKNIKPTEAENISSGGADHTTFDAEFSEHSSKSKWNEDANDKMTSRKKKSKYYKKKNTKINRKTFSNLPVSHVRKVLRNLRISKRNAQLSKPGTSKTESKAKQQKRKDETIINSKLSNSNNGCTANMKIATNTIYKPAAESASNSSFDGNDIDAHPSSSPEVNVLLKPRRHRKKKYKIRKGVRLSKKEFKNPETEIKKQEKMKVKLDPNLRL